MDPSTSLAPRRHERFYFSDGSLCIVVENTLYRIHRFLFETHASRFPAILRDQVQKGTSSDVPYPLGDVNRSDFDRFLACLYPRTLWVEEAKSTAEWMSILKLASKWGFESLQTRAFSNIAETVASPVRMILLGRDYDIPELLLSGYASLCQDTRPLSYGEALELGMKDVVNIYRLRYELYGSSIKPVSFEEALDVVRTYMSPEVREDDAGSGKPNGADISDEVVMIGRTQTPEDNGSDLGEEVVVVGRSQTLEDDSSGETTTLVFNNDSTPSDASDTVPTVEEGPTHSQALEPEQADVLEPKVEPAAPVSGGGGITTTRSVSSPESSSSHHEGTSIATLPCGIAHPLNFAAEDLGLQLLDNLSVENFDPVVDQIINWVNVNGNGHSLKQITRLIVGKAIDEPRQSDLCIRLCKEMARGKRINNKIQDRNIIDQNNKPVTGGLLFCGYLGEICREKLEAVSAAAADKMSAGKPSDALRSAHQAELRRLRLIEFIGALSHIVMASQLSQVIVDQWVAGLLADLYNEEKAVTLCLLLTRTGPLWDRSTKKIRKLMNAYFSRIGPVAQSPRSSSRTRTVLQDLLALRRRDWVSNSQ